MQQVRVNVCRHCGSKLLSQDSDCPECGRGAKVGITPLTAHVARMAAKHKRTASKLFWLGLVVTFIGCFLTTSQRVELSGDFFRTTFEAAVHAVMVYMAGLLPAALNSFTPPFLGDNVGLSTRAIILAGCAILIWACRYFARSKGRPEALGFLGALGILGVLVLMLLPGKQKALA